MKKSVKAYKRDVYAFAQKCLATINDGMKIQGGYVEYLIACLKPVWDGAPARFIINLPPRHLKSNICVITVAAREIAVRPASSVLIVSGSDKLGRQSRDALAMILEAKWFQTTFGVEITSANESGFRTSAGGSIRFVSIDGKFTGIGADKIIVDDLVDIGDANNLERLQDINALFDNKVMTRLNNPATGRVIVIAHRLHENDLTGHLLSSYDDWTHDAGTDADWKLIKLAFEAPADETHIAGDVIFRRRKGELLRPNFAQPKELARLRKQTFPISYETFYQQNPGGRCFEKLDASCVGFHGGAFSSDHPLVISVDPARSTSDRSAFSVIQVWAPCQGTHCLVDQSRGRVEYQELKCLLNSACKKYMPSVVLIEDNSNAAGLADKLRSSSFETKLINIGSKSKLERFVPHVELIRAGGIALGPRIDADAFISELIRFPSCETSDQVDAMTLYLEYIATTPNPVPKRRERALGLVLSESQPLPRYY